MFLVSEMKCVALRVDKIYEQLIADFITNCKNYDCFPLFSYNLNMHLLLTVEHDFTIILYSLCICFKQETALQCHCVSTYT